VLAKHLIVRTEAFDPLTKIVGIKCGYADSGASMQTQRLLYLLKVHCGCFLTQTHFYVSDFTYLSPVVIEYGRNM
jgi:hypothetical protein